MTALTPPEFREEFPECTHPHVRCKLCALAQTHPVLLHLVHELYGRQDMQTRGLVRHVAPMFKEAGAEMPAEPSFRRHLMQHINIALITDDWRGRHGVEKERPPQDEYESDLREMEKLYRTLKPILKQVELEIASERGTTSKNGKIKENSYKLVMLIRLFAEARQILQALSTMRTSDRIQRGMLVQHTELLVNLVTEPLGKQLRSLSQQLRTGENPFVVADILDNILRTGTLSDMIANGARSAVDQSCAQYKLRQLH